MGCSWKAFMFWASWVLMAASVGFLIFVVHGVSAKSPQLCIDMGGVQWEGELIVPEWIDQDTGWEGIGLDVLLKAPLLKIPAPHGGEYWLYEDGGDIVVFPFYDLIPTTDDQGRYYGLHHHCDPFIWKGR